MDVVTAFSEIEAFMLNMQKHVDEYTIYGIVRPPEEHEGDKFNTHIHEPFGEVIIRQFYIDDINGWTGNAFFPISETQSIQVDF